MTILNLRFRQFFLFKTKTSDVRSILFIILLSIFVCNSWAQDPNLPPGENFDLSRWKITLPDQTEPSETDLVNGFESADEFYTDPTTGAMVFKCRNDGQTGGSTYPRSELREMLRAGNTSISTTGIGLNNWVFSSSTEEIQQASGGVDGIMTATVAVDHVSETGESNKIGRVIIGQIHASDDEPVRLYYRKLPNNEKGSIYIAHEPTTSAEQWYEMIGSRSSSASDPADGIVLGEKFSYEIKVVFNTLTVTIMRDGKDDVVQVVDMTDSGFANDWMYFKAGNYNQNNSGTPGDYAQVSFFELNVSHSAANESPSVSITSPTNNAQFTEGETVEIIATASDSDGTVSKVEFYQGGTKLGEDSSAPFSYDWTNVGEGNYAISAVAIDNIGSTATSSTVNIVVKSQPTGYDVPYHIPRFQAFLAECKLQAPTSSTIATKSDLINGYSSDNFYVVEGDKIAFNQSGESKRTELRNETNWIISENDRSLHGRLMITEQTCDQVTVVQIHDDANAGSGPNKPLLRIYKHLAKSPANHLWAAVKTDIDGENTTHVDLGLAPEGYFGFDVRLVNGNMIIAINGEEKTNLDVSFWEFPSYWKAGVYLQDDGEATAYFDELYEGDGSEVNHLPLAIISSPQNEEIFASGSDITITVDASDTDGSISKVEFFEGNTKLGEDDTTPYSFVWENVQSGSYTLTANAIDNESGIKRSLGVDIELGVQYKLDLNVNGQGSISTNPSGDSFDENTEVSLIATAATGYQFDGWSGDLSGSQNPNSITMNEDKNVTATFSEIPTYTLSTEIIGNGSISVSPSSATYEKGTSVTLIAVPDADNRFQNWSGDATGNEEEIVLTMNEDLSITATFGLLLASENDGLNGTNNIFLTYPNPINSETLIKYKIKTSDIVSLSIHDVSGKLIKVLINERKNVGTYETKWKVSDDLQSGLYFARLKVGNEERTIRMVLSR